MNQINEQKCPDCGAPLRFDPEAGMMVCDYCGRKIRIVPKTAPAQGTVVDQGGAGPGAEGVQQPPEEQEPIEGLDFDELIGRAEHPEAENLPVYNCVSCGAEVIAPWEQAALTCPYCRNNIVLTDKVSGKLRPDGIIPFRIKPEDLPAAVNKYYKDKKLLPRGFFSKATMGKVTGVYVPFWVFDGRMAGTLNFNASNSQTHRQGDYIITNTNHYRLVREAALNFKDLPVDAGSKVDDRLMDSLEPFATQEAKGFDMRYLAGFTADRFDQGKEDMAGRAENRMRKSTVSLTAAKATAGYANATPFSQKLRSDLKARYLLFPVYMFDVEHDRKKYHFAVNGQTGKVVGDLPIDKGTSFRYFAGHAGILSAALFALAAIVYLVGM